ncbi:MAG: hypothetical protein IJB65_02495 [Clostridia bacterium]|nr:hypothetical protein [Clostridia bacterium]
MENEHVKKADTPAKKSKAFKISLIIYSSVLAVLAVAALTVLWILLDSYQKSDSQTTAELELERLGEEQWLNYFESNIYISEFENSEDATRLAYKYFLEEKELFCSRKAAECNENTEVFNISNGDRSICKLLLKKSGKGAFGFDRWSFDRLEAPDRKLEDVNKELLVLLPAESELLINGTVADLSLAQKTECPYNAPGDGEPDYALFSFKKPWGDCMLEAYYQKDGESKKQQLKLEQLEGFDYVYDIPWRTSCRITVPAGSELYVNGERISTDYIKESNAPYTEISPLEAHLENAPKATVYEITGLYEEPELKALYNGEEMNLDDLNGFYSFYLPYKLSSYEIMVPNDATVTINGIALSSEYLVETDMLYSEVAEYSQLLVNAKTLYRYKIDGLLFKPEIEVRDSFGSVCELTRTSATEYRCNAAPSPELIEEYDRFTAEFAIAMVEYSMEGQDYVAGNLAEALAFTGFESNAYNVINGAYWGMYWQMNHTLTYNKLYTDNYISYADNAFTCDIHFDVVGERISYPGRLDYSSGIYKVLCIETGGELKIMELSIETPSDKNNAEE